jgi:hypothetical protein
VHQGDQRYLRRGVWQSRITLSVLLLAIASRAQRTPPSTGGDHSAPVALQEERKRLGGRTDPAAIKQWQSILDEMHLSNDPELKGTVQGLRAPSNCMTTNPGSIGRSPAGKNRTNAVRLRGS